MLKDYLSSSLYWLWRATIL